MAKIVGNAKRPTSTKKTRHIQLECEIVCCIALNEAGGEKNFSARTVVSLFTVTE